MFGFFHLDPPKSIHNFFPLSRPLEAGTGRFPGQVVAGLEFDDCAYSSMGTHGVHDTARTLQFSGNVIFRDTWGCATSS